MMRAKLVLAAALAALLVAPVFSATTPQHKKVTRKAARRRPVHSRPTQKPVDTAPPEVVVETKPYIATPEAMRASALDALRQTGAKGLAIALIDEGKVISTQAFGVRDDHGTPLVKDTVLYGASLTKTVFAYAVLMMADEGKLSLDTPIADLLPKPLPEYGNLEDYGNWADLNGDDRWRRITPRMVLTQSTGFPNFSFLQPDGKLKIFYDPGTRYAYSGEGFMLLQFALEKGKHRYDMGAEIKSRIFTPLGLTRTDMRWNEAFANNTAQGFSADGKAKPPHESQHVRAAGSMNTTIEDMASFTAAMVRGWGLTAERRAEFVRGQLPITTRTQFPTLQFDAPPPEQVKGLSAGLGVVTFEGPQGAGFYKGGHDDQTANQMVCIERGARCVVLLSNDVRIEKAYAALVRTALGETGWPAHWELGLP